MSLTQPLTESTSADPSVIVPRRVKVWHLLLILGLLSFVVGWGVLFWSVGRSAERLLYEDENPDAAIASLEFWSPWMLQPQSWRWLTADAYRKKGDTARVKRLTDEMAASGMNQTRATAPLLLLESSAGMPIRVQENLAVLLEIYGTHQSEVFSSLVQGYISKGEIESASHALRLWTDESENDANLLYWQGVLQSATYNLPGAIDRFRRAIERKPNFEKAHWELAELLVELALFEEAKTEFEWLTARNPKETTYITGYARSLLNLGYPEDAAKELAKLKDPLPLPSQELALVCETNLESGDAQLAKNQAAELVRRWPEVGPYLQLLARCTAKLGNQSESDALFGKAAESQSHRAEIDQMVDRLKVDQSNIPLRKQLGEAMMKYLDPSAGVGYLQMTVRTNPRDEQCHQWIAEFFTREGNMERAQMHQRILRDLQRMSGVSRSADPTLTPTATATQP